jgi:hypothetical protein
MALPCPRCDDSLVESPALVDGDGGGGPILLETCPSCAGLWIDGTKLAVVCPTLADLPARAFEISLIGRPGAGIPTCPRCDNTPFELTVLDVAIDAMKGCRIGGARSCSH